MAAAGATNINSSVFEKSGAPATRKDLKVGDKVIVHADLSGAKLVANEVHFGATKGEALQQGNGGMDHK